MSREYTRQINLYINGSKVKNDIKSISAEMRKLVNEQSRMTVGSKEYVAHGKKIQALKSVLAKHNAQLKQTTKSWQGMSRAANAFNKYWQMGAMAVAGAVGFVMAFRKTAEAANEFEASLDNLSALTGLEGRELEWLGEKAKESSVAILESGVRIRQSASDINDAYRKMGSQRPELLRDKEALGEVTENAIILSEAAKIKLEPAVSALATTMNQFNAKASDSGEVINILAAGSKLGAGDIEYLNTAIEKSGTTMALMNLSVADNVALVEAVAPKYAQASQAGNSLDKVLLKMRTQQIGFKDGQFDMNRALDELRIRFDQGESSVEIFGERHAKMVEVLLQAQPAYNKFKEGVTGTNIAIEQAVKNTNNNATALDQAKNKVKLMYIEIGTKLAPALVKSTNGWNYMLKGMMALPEFLKKNQVLLIALGGAILAKNALVIKSIVLTIQEKAVLGKLFVQEKYNLVAMNAKSVAIRTNIMLTGKSTMAQKKALIATRTLNKAMKMNPIGMVILGITALIGAMKFYETHNKRAVDLERRKKKAIEDSTKANEALKETYDGIRQEIGSLNTLSIQEKKDLQDKITATIELAEAELLLYESKRKTLYDEENKVKWYQGILTWNKEKIVERGMKNAKKAVAGLDEQLDGLRDRLAGLKRQDFDLTEILNAESIGDQIGTETLISMEEKLTKYNLALKNVAKDSEAFYRIQNKIANLEREMARARGVNVSGSGADLAKENVDKLKEAYRQLRKELDLTEDSFDKISEAWDKELLGSLEDIEVPDEIKTEYMYWLESTYEGRKELLKQNLKDGIIAQQEYADKIKAIDNEMTANKVKNFSDYGDAVMSMTGAISSFSEARKKKELSNERLTDKAKEKIEKKYAKRQRAMASFETVLQGVLEIARINSNAGVNADLTQTLRVILTAAAVARTAGSLAMINAQKYEKGKYPVLDGDSGRTYQSAFVGPVKTGLYDKPSLGLFSEKEPEMVIDGPTTRNLMTNFPEIITAIQNARVGQYAEGMYPDVGSGGSNADMKMLMQTVIATMLQVKKSHEKPSNVSYQAILDANETYQEIQERVTM